MHTPYARDQRPAPPRRRWRRWVRGAGIAVGGIVLAAVLALGWLVGSGGGRDFVLRQVAARLPDGTALTWSRADGTLLGGMTLDDVYYRQDSPALNLSVRRLHLAPALWPLLAKRVEFTTLELTGARLELPPATPEPFAWPRWPDVLADISLPLTLAARELVLDGFTITRQGEELLAIHHARGALGIGSDGVHAGNLTFDSGHGRFRIDGHYAPHTAGGIDLTASALLPVAAGQVRPRFGLVARGGVDALTVALSGYAPEPVSALWSLRGTDAPQWTLTAQSDALDIGLITRGVAGTAAAFSLDADGADDTARWQGRWQQGALTVALLHPSRVQVRGTRLELESARLHLDAPDVSGSFDAAGSADFGAPAATRFTLALNTDDLTLAGATPVRVRGRVELDGQPEAWSARGHAALTRSSQQAGVTLAAHGDAGRLRMDSLHVTMPGGHLDASGALVWQPGLGWDADAVLGGFDPGWFIPDWPGALSARIHSSASTDAAGTLHIDAAARDLGGQLRQRAVGGHLAFSLSAPATASTQMHGEADLRMGASRIAANVRWGGQVDIAARVSPLDLADLLPAASGQLRGRVQVYGTPAAPAISAELGGRNLHWNAVQAAALELHGTLPARSDEDGTLALRMEGIRAAGIELERVALEAAGTTRDTRISVQAAGGAGTLAASGTLDRHTRSWRGSVDALQWIPAQDARWDLQAPVGYAQTRSGWTLQRGCLAASGGGGEICAAVDWPRQVNLGARAVPLALAAPLTAQWLPEPAPGHPWRLRGAFDLDADIHRPGTAWQGRIGLHSSAGGLRASERAPRDIIGYHDLALAIDLTTDAIRASMQAGLDDNGQIRLALDTGLAADAALDGSLTLDVRDLTWLELLAQDIAASSGHLTGTLGVSGTRAQPELRGQAHLGGFSAELPALALTLEDGEVNLTAEADGNARIVGAVRSGEGTLHVDGSLDWRGGDTPLLLNVHGTRVLASDTRDLRLVIDPDLSVRHAPGQPLAVSGRVGVASGLLDLERLDSGVSVSDDVVVLDPATTARARGATPLRLDLSLEMGDDVRLRGFGLTGKLDGNLHVRAEPGHEMTGSGRLDVSGGYKAYGQALAITRGTLTFSNSPVADPVIELSAERKIEAEGITAGITVSGRATAPDVAVWSNPASDNTQALAYLAFGRSLSSLTSSQGQQLDASAAALAAGGNLLAGQIGHRIGLDDAGVTTSSTLGGSVLGIGKQLSPRLYVGFGVSLLGTGQMLTLKYLLRKGFDVELESSTVENRGSVNWRHEGD